MREIHEIDKLEDFLDRNLKLRDCVIQGLDLGDVEADWDHTTVEGSVFLGCKFPSLAFQERLREGGALIFPRLPRLPYRSYRPDLYSSRELAKDNLDLKIYSHFEKFGRHSPNVLEALAQRMHDHSIDDALHDLLEGRTDGLGPKKVVAIMGGHSTPRTDPFFEKVALVARELTRLGFFIASGGGPGMMEAANLGAWMAPYKDNDLCKVLEIIGAAPVYTHASYEETALQAVREYPDGAASVAIPTWFYGHEPSNQFSTWIAKYFSNSLREDGLLAIAKYGVIYSPGSAGTRQEIFMDAAQNHYGTFEYVSPMIFLGKETYEESSGLFSTLSRLAEGKQFGEMLGLSDDPEEIVKMIVDNPPVKYEG